MSVKHFTGPLVVGANQTPATVSGNGVQIVSGDVQLDAGNVVITSGNLTLTSGTLKQTAGLSSSSFANITAGTTQTQAGATAITTNIVRVTTGNASDGVILPALSTALIGTVIILINASANAGVVYCPGATTTNTINGTAGATGVAYAGSKTLTLIAVSATAWVSTLSN